MDGGKHKFSTICNIYAPTVASFTTEIVGVLEAVAATELDSERLGAPSPPPLEVPLSTSGAASRE